MSNGDRIKYPKYHGYKICNILEKKIKEKLKNIIDVIQNINKNKK